ncbi:hypothetical protein F4820DRAFT_433376 [Hypoxylon rubiginosum]|uniref:Uncharacterized protein n=1 Tax=Hypoxylon rubiginosum TaxID=110542 RepID=A0ACB9YQN2_9PEZI|nr:hypothetical protein F4820DRAFT_433376 [Hypoxylon rubiginosum]
MQFSENDLDRLLIVGCFLIISYIVATDRSGSIYSSNITYMRYLDTVTLGTNIYRLVRPDQAEYLYERTGLLAVALGIVGGGKVVWKGP